jgi:cytochrome c
MAETITVSMLALSAVIFIISFIFIYRYRTSFKVEAILKSFRKLVNPSYVNPEDENVQEIEKYEDYVENANATSGLVGKYLLLTAAYLFAGTTALASSPNQWEHVGNILQVIFSWQTIFNFLALISLAGIVTGAAIVFYFFKWQGGLKHMTDDYADFVKKFAGNLTLASGISFPLMLLLSYVFLPSAAQSPSVFFYMIVVLIVTLILCNMVYSMVKTSDTSSAAVIFGLVIVLIFFNVIKDQAAFSNANYENTLEITKKASEHEEEAKTKIMQSAGIDPQQIFNQKCIACHKFDQKLVGPPYDQTVPKYNGDVQKLAAYIFNPQKIDPNYPPMPNQGLKKKEATAMAQWLINKVGKK